MSKLPFNILFNCTDSNREGYFKMAWFDTWVILPQILTTHVCGYQNYKGIIQMKYFQWKNSLKNGAAEGIRKLAYLWQSKYSVLGIIYKNRVN